MQLKTFPPVVVLMNHWTMANSSDTENMNKIVYGCEWNPYSANGYLQLQQSLQSNPSNVYIQSRPPTTGQY